VLLKHQNEQKIFIIVLSARNLLGFRRNEIKVVPEQNRLLGKKWKRRERVLGIQTRSSVEEM